MFAINMLDDIKSFIKTRNEISANNLLEILKEYAKTVSVFDLMDMYLVFLSSVKYVQRDFCNKTHEMYVKCFINRIKEVKDDNNRYPKLIDIDDLNKAISILDNISKNEAKDTGLLVYFIVSLYTTYIIEKPIHSVGCEFPGSLKVIQKDGLYYCPVKKANLESPNAVCKICISKQLDF